MKIAYIILIFFITAITLDASTVYFNGEDGRSDSWIADGEGVIQNIYNEETESRVISLAPGTYDIGLGDRSWNNTTQRILSWNMNITGRYTIYVSVNTTMGHRWLFYNDLNVHVGFHGAGILNGFGGVQSHNGTWQKVVLDLDRELQDTEPDNRIISVDGMRFAGGLGLIDNITLDNPTRKIYEDASSGAGNWQITDNTPTGATATVIFDDEEVTLNGNGNPFVTVYNDNVIQLHGSGQDNAFTIGAVNGADAWNDINNTVLQWKMRNSATFTVLVHVLTEDGEKDLVYTPDRSPDQGLSANGLEIHHCLGWSRNGNGVPYSDSTDGRWITYTRDLVEDLHDYDPDNKIIAVNGMTIRGDTLLDDLLLFPADKISYNYPNSERNVYMEDAEDETIDGWEVLEGEADSITNIYDEEIESRVIQLNGGGSYRLGDIDGDGAWNHTHHKSIAWRMRTTNEYTIYVAVQTTLGLRYLFYTFSPNRGLLHGFENGIHHGLGDATISGRWRTVTRDLERDLKDAEPENELISINAFIYNGGDGGRIDDIILYTPESTLYEDGESGVDGWFVSDDTPAGATITNIADNDNQGRHLQGNIISLTGTGADNAYRLGAVTGDNAWANSNQKIVQWRFRNFGPEVEVIDPRGIIRDPEAFEFRVSVETTDGARDLVYTLGATHLGLIEGGTTIHHGLGDDRIRGSVWAGDDPMNELGLWQTITRDLEEDLRDFDTHNTILSVNAIQVRNSGLVDDIKMLNNAVEYENNSLVNMYENAENGNTEGWSLFSNDSGTATITNVEDPDKLGRVISLQGVGRGDGYVLRDGVEAWNDSENSILRWSMKYAEEFTLYISVETSNGRRYLTYTPIDEDRGISGEYIRLGLGVDADNGEWQTFTRDLQADIESQEADNELISINSFIIRGSGRVDDIQTIANMSVPIEDTIRPIITLLGSPTESIVLGSNYVDAGAVATDSLDGNISSRIVVVNPVDSNVAGTYTITYDVNDTADNSAIQVTRVVTVLSEPDPNIHVYEDAEDGTTDGWSVYANSSGTATITNVMDNDKGDRVIELNGVGIGDGYGLGVVAWWNDRDNNSIRWSMNYSEQFTVYISVQTTNGYRYLIYRPLNENGGLSGESISVGIGTNASNGEWQTFTRNLALDISNAEAGNELIAINNFLIRGSGRVDDIETLELQGEGDGNIEDEDHHFYEDAEDGTTDGWSVYANSSGTATITNVVDNDKGGRVIELNGVGIGDGYGLGVVAWWNDRDHNSVRWSMNYNEQFTVYISVQTTNGYRYLVYRPTDENAGLSGETISIGIGTDASNGAWHTFTRNIALDISNAEAGNELIAINNFLIRGSGHVDDILTLNQ